MAFGLQKLAVLESKLDIYEDLSKEMLDKLERAVVEISANSNRVAIILERHENRLDKSDENDLSIMKLIEKIEEKVEQIEVKVSDLSRFRWITIGVCLSAMAAINAPAIFANLLTSQPHSATIERTK